MKQFLLLSMLAALPLVAQETTDSSAAGASQDSREAARQAHRERLVQKFDANKDGKLDEEEKAAMQKFIEERRKGGAHREGQGRGHGRGGAHGGRRGGEGRGEGRGGKDALLKRFDKDQDGKLDDEERAEMKKAMQRRHRGAGAEATPQQPQE